jgi:hypothetical protein
LPGEIGEMRRIGDDEKLWRFDFAMGLKPGAQGEFRAYAGRIPAGEGKRPL